MERVPGTIGIMFEPGNYVEGSLVYGDPAVSGDDALGFLTGDVAKSFTTGSLGIKLQFSERLAGALIYNQPYGIDVAYGSDSPIFSGTTTNWDSNALTALLRYKFDDNWSVYGGLRGVQNSGDAVVSGAGAGALAGYQADLSEELDYGYLIGASYEIPDIALRVALTFASSIDVDATATESVPAAAGGPATLTSDLNYELPKSLTLDFQSGVAPKTLVFGPVRWVEWSRFNISPAFYTGAVGQPLASWPEDVITYELGVAHQATDRLALASTISYEDERNKDGANALGPYNGFVAVGLGAQYEVDDWRISAGVKRYWLKDANVPSPLGGTLGSFQDNTAVAVEMKIG